MQQLILVELEIKNLLIYAIIFEIPYLEKTSTIRVPTQLDKVVQIILAPLKTRRSTAFNSVM